MFNNPQFWWFLSRASGIVAWALLTGSVLWGILLATRMLKAIDRPAWLLDLHRWLSALTIFAVALHLVALYADSYVKFSVTDLMVPFVATWRPFAVALGVFATYLLLIVQVSSLLMKRLPRKIWRSIHLTSYVMFVFVILHSFLAGHDRGASMFVSFSAVLISVTAIATAIRVRYATSPSKTTTRKAIIKL